METAFFVFKLVAFFPKCVIHYNRSYSPAGNQRCPGVVWCYLIIYFFLHRPVNGIQIIVQCGKFPGNNFFGKKTFFTDACNYFYRFVWRVSRKVPAVEQLGYYVQPHCFGRRYHHLFYFSAGTHSQLGNHNYTQYIILPDLFFFENITLCISTK